MTAGATSLHGAVTRPATPPGPSGVAGREVIAAPTLAVIAIPWLPLALLALAHGSASGTAGAFVRDPIVHVRFLIALPLLWLSRTWFDAHMASVLSYLRRGHFIAEDEAGARFSRDAEAALRVPETGWAAGLALGWGYASTWIEQLAVRSDVRAAGWRVLEAGSPTAAGYWRLAVAAPIFNAVLLLVAWRVVTYLWFVCRLRRHFVPVPGHPDEMSGLFGVGRVAVDFAPVVFAMSSLMAASLGAGYAHGGPSVLAYRGGILAFALLIPLPFVWPLFLYVPRLALKKRRALLDYGVTAAAFARRYEPHLSHTYEGASAVADDAVSTDADLGGSFRRHRESAIVPVPKLSVLSLSGAALLPFVVLAFAQLGWQASLEMLSHLREVVLG